ncbi:MAG TPA: zincin-like metallopeptidase domain-containing protein [Xanthobacteraceae bacterium]
MQIQQLYESVTASIIADLQAGVIPWTKPWKNGRMTGVLPHNGATNRAYNGINIVLLWAKRQEMNYTTANWMTYQQAHTVGAQVRAGEKSTTIVFTKKLAVKDKETEEDKSIRMLRTYSVFNENQIDGLPRKDVEILPPETRIEHVEAFVQATRADIRIEGNRACYVPDRDNICLPPKHLFNTLEHFYATALHELSHWTGAERRLNRDMSGRFKTRAYAAEELVAEFSAAFLCAHLGIKGELRHADYIANWLELLKEDDRAVFTAASKASQAADYLRSYSEQPPRVL